MSTICQKSMILPEQKSEIYCHLDFHPKSQPRNVLKMFLVFQEIEPIVLINVFLYKKTECIWFAGVGWQRRLRACDVARVPAGPCPG